jgi:hypothetical protein
MKVKFFLLSFILLFARGCDFYSTSLWFFQPDGHLGETNPLTSVFGFGWNGLGISNIILVGSIIAAFYYYSFKYKSPGVPTPVHRLTDFVSQLYFNERGRFMHIFYKTPKNKKVLIAHLGYVLTWTAIVGSFLATFHNLCQFYQAGFYDTFREIAGRPLYVIYGLIGLTIVFFTRRVWRKEYKAMLNAKC